MWNAEHRSVAVVFAAFGVFNGTWISRIPAIAEHLELNTTRLSLALLSAPVGQLVAAQLAPSLARRWTGASVTRAGIPLAGALLVLPGIATGLTSLALSLAAFGLAMGVLDIGMNSQGVVVERHLERPVMSGLHGVFSFGAFAGAGLGGAAAHLAIGPAPHFAAVGTLGALLGLAGARHLLGGQAEAVNPGREGADAPPRSSILRRPRVLLLGIIAFCVLFAEGSVENWSGVYLHRSLGGSLAVAPYGAAACGAAMAIGRLSGDRVIARWGRQRTLSGSAALAAVGLAVTVAASGLWAAVAGYAIFGFGVATIVPITFTLAGTLPGVSPAWAISRVTTIGFAGLYGAAPAIGLAAGAVGLRTSLGAPAVLVGLVLPLSVLLARGPEQRRG